MPEEDYPVEPSSHLMQPVEIEKLAKIFVNLGVNKIRLTGGEPLVRKDAGKIVDMLARLPVELTLTTNGLLLHKYLPQLQAARVRSLNISLDTLNAEKFFLITRRNHFNEVWKNIHKAVDAGLHVKLNVVALKGINDTEINDFVALTKDMPVHVRFIEFMPFPGNQWKTAQVLSLKEILQTIESSYSIIKLKDGLNDTTKKYIVPGHVGTIAVISSITSHFCGTCNRIRLTADGKIKNCLFSTGETDLLTPLRNDEDVEQLIRNNILDKHAAHGGQFASIMEQSQPVATQNRTMISIGG